MSVEKKSRHSFFIPKYGGNLLHYYPNKRDNPGDFFPMPKAAFRLGLDSGEIAVLAFLMYCEDGDLSRIKSKPKGGLGHREILAGDISFVLIMVQ